MYMKQATEVRKEWSSYCDSIVHDKPQFVKRTRDKMCFSSFDTMLDILSVYVFHAERFYEEDGSITLSLIEIDLVENAKTEEETLQLMAKSILEYSLEYYENYKMYSNSSNRKSHVPYVLKTLLLGNVQEIGENIVCQNGKNF